MAFSINIDFHYTVVSYQCLNISVRSINGSKFIDIFIVKVLRKVHVGSGCSPLKNPMQAGQAGGKGSLLYFKRCWQLRGGGCQASVQRPTPPLPLATSGARAIDRAGENYIQKQHSEL